MTHGSIIGYDINAKMCQISYYNEKTQEPETVDTGIEKENNQIPLVMNYYKETWTYGRQARRMSTVRDSICVEGIWECALGNRKIEVDGQEYEGVQLLADFVKYTLNGFEEIESITFTVPEKNEDIRVLLKGIGQKLGVAKENIYVQDYKESFCHYMFNQPKELWQYEAALFYCDEDVIRAYMLRELKNSSQKSRESFVTVTPEDFESDHPLAGIAFQRKLEKAAYKAGKGKIPVQRYGDFYRSVTGKEKGKTEAEVWYQGHEPCMKGAYEETDLAGIFPAKISSALVDGMEDFNKKIRGFSHPLSILSGVESRTSSPVRIVRDNHSLESVIGGLYPCGEGAGYAGGITSAAADGIKIAEKIRQKYAPFL